MVFLFCIALIAVYCLVFVVIFGDTDRCLDNGGSWDKEQNVCLH
jgi:hypothetical protein